jgi:hypothetical protein
MIQLFGVAGLFLLSAQPVQRIKRRTATRLQDA